MKKKFLLPMLSAAAALILSAPVCMADTDIYTEDFNVGDMSYSEFRDYANSKGGAQWMFSTFGYREFYPAEFSTNDFATITDKLGADVQGAAIEDGRLKLMKKAGYERAQHITTLQFPSKCSGQISLKFDIELKSYSGYTTSKISLREGETTTADIGSNEYTLFLGHQAEGGQYPLGGNWGYFKDKGPVTVELIVDYDKQEFWAYTDGQITPAKKNFKTTDGTKTGFDKLRIYTTGSSGDDNINLVVYIDNLSIMQLDKPVITSQSVSDGDNGTEITGPRFNFSVPVLKRGVASGFKLYENGVLAEDADFQLSDDGMSLALNKELKYSTPYKIEIDDTVVAENKLYLPAETINFHTKHKPAELTLESAAFKSGDGSQTVTSLSGLDSVMFEAAFSNSSETENSPAIIILALYDAEGIMQQVKCIQVSAKIGEQTEARVSMELPENKTGLRAAAYMWNSLGKMELIKESFDLE